jgi:hypothetical protein
MINYFRIQSANIPWGDYGVVLINGIIQESTNGQIYYSRTVPYIPSIIENMGHLIIDENVYQVLCSVLPSIQCEMIRIDKLIELNWHTWNIYEDDPQVYPSSGEPEGYFDDFDNVLSRYTHLNLFRVIPKVIDTKDVTNQSVNVQDDLSHPVVRFSDNPFKIYVSHGLKNLLEPESNSWVSFHDISV